MLEITTTKAQQGMETIPGTFDIQSRKASLELDRQIPQVNVHTEHVIVEIDQSEAFASAGLKRYWQLGREFAEGGKQAALEYIAKLAQDGDRFAAIEIGGNPIADMAERDAYPEHEFIMGTMPSAPPKFNIREGKVTFDPEPINDYDTKNTITASYVPGELNINYRPGRLNIFMVQYNSISIEYKSDKVDIRI